MRSLPPERQQYWARRLGPTLRNPEPIEDQLRLARGVAATLTGVVGVIGSIILAIFAAFGRPEIGLAVVACTLMPIILLAWTGYSKRKRLVRGYLKELAGAEAHPPAGTSD